MNVVEEQQLRSAMKKLEARVRDLELRLDAGGETEHGDRVTFVRRTAGESTMGRVLAAMRSKL